MAAPFVGFPREGIDFFKQLQRNNNREWFLAHKDVYERCCRAPMQALVAELEPRFGTTKISRINRDMRFSRDGAPYKTYIAAGVGGHYISLSANGLFVGAGLYKPDAAVLQRFRAAIADDATGRELERIVKSLRRNGYDVAAHQTLASAPRGYTVDHPRIELLQMKDIYAGRMFEPAPWLSTAGARQRIDRVMTDTGALVAWLRQHVGAPSDGARSRARSRSATPARSHSRRWQTG
jgi:uncharacterized protein (TIGR02453 family)